ncbi:hypothetical protein FHETE_599 [Fusarium heterosporum]|uniref:2EXR domain-containing protein n=1 Tax=Fusarium heterosporum TaxID=42747 RepID=A0A8H5U2N3_FUSHE|nr:hypothetical protein FHETE_599 [Fusarium heterosporum]
MAINFHNFAELPKELRDMIWKMALRPDVPGVHLFKIQNSATSPFDETIAVTPNGIRSNRPVTAACTPYPSGSIHGTPSDICSWWEAGNTSTYHVDTGLWGACNESKSIVKHETSNMMEIRFVSSETITGVSRADPDSVIRGDVLSCRTLQQLGAMGPQPQQGPAENGAAKFHASKRRLVEVKFTTEARSWGDWVELRDTGGSSNCPASIQAVRQLNQNLKTYKSIGLKVWKKIGLLGWEQP